MTESADNRTLFTEWQLPNLSSFLPNLLFAPALWLVFAPINQFVGTFSGISLTIVSIALRVLVAKRIAVTESALIIGKAEIPRQVLGEATSIVKVEQFAERGPRLHAAAFLALKSGLPGLVKVQIVDKKDPTPYVLISTRKPAELVTSLQN